MCSFEAFLLQKCLSHKELEKLCQQLEHDRCGSGCKGGWSGPPQFFIPPSRGCLPKSWNWLIVVFMNFPRWDLGALKWFKLQHGCAMLFFFVSLFWDPPVGSRNKKHIPRHLRDLQTARNCHSVSKTDFHCYPPWESVWVHYWNFEVDNHCGFGNFH